MAATSIETEFVAEARLKLAAPLNVGKVYTGNRIVVHVTGGTLKGPGINAECLGGGDWIHVGDNGFARLDVRLVFKTDDGAIIYGAYTGVLETNPGVLAVLGGGPDAKSTSFEDQYFRSVPVFETTSEKYQWLTKSAFVAKGRFEINDDKGPVTYDIFRIK